MTISGELDLAIAERLADELRAAEQVAAGAVQLDLSGVTFIDASAFRVLDAAARRLADRGRRLEIVRKSPQVDRLLTTLKWTRSAS